MEHTVLCATAKIWSTWHTSHWGITCLYMNRFSLGYQMSFLSPVQYIWWGFLCLTLCPSHTLTDCANYVAVFLFAKQETVKARLSFFPSILPSPILTLDFLEQYNSWMHSRFTILVRAEAGVMSSNTNSASQYVLTGSNLNHVTG